MGLDTSLYAGKLIALAPIDHEADAEIESGWTHDAEFMRLASLDPARPLAPGQVKKRYEAIEKEAEEKKNLFYFTIRDRADGRLLGFTHISSVEWVNGNGVVNIAIGDPADRGRGFAGEALRLLIRYAFSELGLYRLTALIPDYNPAALRFFHRAGFADEVRQREAVARFGRRWDLVRLGLLRREWNGRNNTDE